MLRAVQNGKIPGLDPCSTVMTISEQQIKAILALPAQKRYEHFVKQVADWGEVWGLYQDGWAVAADDNGNFVLPVWPAMQYARLCATDDWQNYEPSSIELERFLSEFLPKLTKDTVQLGVFYTPKNEGMVLKAEQIVDDLREELRNYS